MTTRPTHHTARQAGGERGQATVELTALLPLLLVVALSACAALAARSADEHAGAAAEAGAIALIHDRDPRAAARDVLPRSVRRRATTTLDGRRVTVTVRPRVPLLARWLTARAAADAGPEPAGSVRPTGVAVPGPAGSVRPTGVAVPGPAAGVHPAAVVSGRPTVADRRGTS